MWVRNAINTLKARFGVDRTSLIAGQDATKAVTAFDICELLFHYQPFARSSFLGFVSGTGAVVTNGGVATFLNAPTSGSGHAISRVYGTSQVDQTYSLWDTSATTQIDWSKSKRIGARARFNTPTDPNLIVTCLWGILETDAVGDFPSGRKGIGIRCVGHATTPYLQLIVGSGSGSPTIVDSSYIVTGAAFNWTIYSDGNGNVYLYVNGSQVASTASGPTGTTVSSVISYREQIVASATPASAFSRWVNARGGYLC